MLIHGHPFDRSLWQPQLSALAGDFCVLAPGLRGFGQSPGTPRSVSMREYAEDTVELLDRLGVDRAAIAGLSMGGRSWSPATAPDISRTSKPRTRSTTHWPGS